MNNPSKEVITLTMTGASGAVYGLRVLQLLLQAQYSVYFVCSDAARIVIETELKLTLSKDNEQTKRTLSKYLDVATDHLTLFESHDWFSPMASGSSAPKQMVIAPCSMGTLASIAHGLSDNLIERAADVQLKERKKLIIVVREMPYSAIHLENMLKLTQMGAIILPASPGFYHNPTTIDQLVDFVVARILEQLSVPQQIIKPWMANEYK